MMNPIKKMLDMASKNSLAVKPTTARCVIWTGLMYTEDGRIVKCPGYEKDRRIVWVALKDRFNALAKGVWDNESSFQVSETLKRRLSAGQVEEQILERKRRDSGMGQLLNTDRSEVNFDDLIDIQSTSVYASKEPVTDMWQQLAFYEIEVQQVMLAPNEGIGLDRAAPGGIVDPAFCEVEVMISSTGKIISMNGRLVQKSTVDPSTQVRVPRGAGEKIRDYRDRKSLEVEVPKGGDASFRIKRGMYNLESLYSARCAVQDPEIQLDGDVWVEGVRSSLTRGLYEVWTDDLRMGPMLRISRNAVQEAAARYTRYTAAAEQRYATERDHPASADIASTAISPIKVYIDDWFGDPNLYVGLMQFIMQLASGLDNDGSKNSYEKLYYDEGVTDYGKLYNQYEGADI